MLYIEYLHIDYIRYILICIFVLAVVEGLYSLLSIGVGWVDTRLYNLTLKKSHSEKCKKR